jgi:CYTH domain-containing protein
MEMVQGFLSTDPERTVRVRRMGDKGWITIKGITRAGGTTRNEWEYPIPPSEAEALLAICLPLRIRKIRYTIPMGAHTFEVDEFLEENEGLVLAEIELKAPDESFERPAWLGTEVTGDSAYYNSQLSLKPYRSWRN